MLDICREHKQQKIPIMMSPRVANMFIFFVSVVMTLMVFAIFIYIILSHEYKYYYNTLIGTGIGFISGIGLSLYIWLNRNKMEL